MTREYNFDEIELEALIDLLKERKTDILHSNLTTETANEFLYKLIYSLKNEKFLKSASSIFNAIMFLINNYQDLATEKLVVNLIELDKKLDKKYKFGHDNTLIFAIIAALKANSKLAFIQNIRHQYILINITKSYISRYDNICSRIDICICRLLTTLFECISNEKFFEFSFFEELFDQIMLLLRYNQTLSTDLYEIGSVKYTYLLKSLARIIKENYLSKCCDSKSYRRNLDDVESFLRRVSHIIHIEKYTYEARIQFQIEEIKNCKNAIDYYSTQIERDMQFLDRSIEVTTATREY